VRHFATLAAIAEAGSFRAAAARRGYVPSAVSQQIADLERIVGTELVERRRGQRGVVLTPAGQRLAAHGRSIIASFEAAQADLAGIDGGPGPTRLALSRPLVELLVPLISRALGAGLVITETDDDDEPARQVERGVADLAIGPFPDQSMTVDAVLLAADPYMVLVPETAAVPGALTVEDLTGARLIVPAGGRSAADVMSRLSSLGIPTADAIRAHPGDVAALVRAGVGRAIISHSMRWGDEAGLARRSAQHLIGTRALAAIWQRRRLSRFAQAVRLLDEVDAIRGALAT
jgi:molybdate transport repressor ModE-like protein